MKTILDDPQHAARVAWRRAFDEQLTRPMLKRVRRYAAQRARVMADALGLDKKSGADELVNDAITATLDATRRWDPATRTLEHHFINVIRAQTGKAAERLARHPQKSIDDTSDDTSSDGYPIENKATMLNLPDAASEPPRKRDVEVAALRVVADMHALADGDADVLRILDTLSAGVDEGDLIKASRLSASRFRNARRRLARLVVRLPIDTRAAAEAVL